MTRSDAVAPAIAETERRPVDRRDVDAHVVSIARLATRRRSWWVPPLAFLAAIGILFGGAAVAQLGTQQGPRPAWSPEEPSACRPAPDDPYRCTEYRTW